MNMIDLEGEVAIVTGGAQGIGFATAERLTKSGANVCLFDIDQEIANKASEELVKSVLHFKSTLQTSLTLKRRAPLLPRNMEKFQFWSTRRV